MKIWNIWNEIFCGKIKTVYDVTYILSAALEYVVHKDLTCLLVATVLVEGVNV